jgi:hypothetical protein
MFHQRYAGYALAKQNGFAGMGGVQPNGNFGVREFGDQALAPAMYGISKAQQDIEYNVMSETYQQVYTAEVPDYKELVYVPDFQMANQGWGVEHAPPLLRRPPTSKQGPTPEPRNRYARERANRERAEPNQFEVPVEKIVEVVKEVVKIVEVLREVEVVKDHYIFKEVPVEKVRKKSKLMSSCNSMTNLNAQSQIVYVDREVPVDKIVEVEKIVEKIVEKEVIVEKIVEILVETIVEKIVITEVPVHHIHHTQPSAHPLQLLQTPIQHIQHPPLHMNVQQIQHVQHLPFPHDASQVQLLPGQFHVSQPGQPVQPSPTFHQQAFPQPPQLCHVENAMESHPPQQIWQLQLQQHPTVASAPQPGPPTQMPQPGPTMQPTIQLSTMPPSAAKTEDDTSTPHPMPARCQC